MTWYVAIQFLIPDLNELTVDQLPEVLFRRSLAGKDWSLEATGSSGTGAQSRKFDYSLTVTVDAVTGDAALAEALAVVDSIPTAAVLNTQVVEVPPAAPELELGSAAAVISTKITVKFRAYCSQASLAALFGGLDPADRPALRVLENRGGDVLAEADFVLTMLADGFDVEQCIETAKKRLAGICDAGGYLFAVEDCTSGPVE